MHRHGEHFLRQDATIGRDDRELGREGLEILKCRAVAHRHRLKNGDILRQSIFLYRAWRDFVSVAWLVRLRENAAHVVPVRDQTL